MNIALVYAPYAFSSLKTGAASIHIAHIISILKRECGVSNVRYIDYNSSPFHLYSRTLKELCKDTLQPAADLLYSESLTLLNRTAIEELLDLPEQERINAVFGIDQELIEKTTSILALALNCMVNEIFSQPCDAILLFVSPDISYALALCALIRKVDRDVPIIVCDNFTFEPATPYFTAPVTRKDLYGFSVETILSCDPLSPILQRMIPQMLNCIIVGEGYDVIRALFKSRYDARSVEGITYLANGTVLSVRLDDVAGLRRKTGVTIVYSQQTDLDSLPLPDFDDMVGTFDSAEFELTRGCPYNCMFCERTGMFGSSVRSHSLEYAERLIRHITDYGFEFYTSIDTALNVDEASTICFLEMLKARGVSFPYQASLRGRRPNRKLIRLLKETGCVEVAIGCETGDDTLLQSMNKVQDTSILNDLIGCIGQHDMRVLLFLIVGYPTETSESVDKTLRFIASIHPHSMIDLVEVELYRAGHIQALGPRNFERYGIEWSRLQSLSEIERSSYLFFEPGLCGQATYKFGMSRSEIRNAIDKYRFQLAALGVDIVVGHPSTPSDPSLSVEGRAVYTSGGLS